MTCILDFCCCCIIPSVSKIFSCASHMCEVRHVRGATQVVRMPCVCMYVCVCVKIFFPNNAPSHPLWKHDFSAHLVWYMHVCG